MSETNLLAYRVEQLEGQEAEYKKSLEKMRDEMVALRREVEDRDKRRLRWGITVLGGMVSSAGVVIWEYIVKAKLL